MIIREKNETQAMTSCKIDLCADRQTYRLRSYQEVEDGNSFDETFAYSDQSANVIEKEENAYVYDCPRKEKIQATSYCKRDFSADERTSGLRSNLIIMNPINHYDHPTTNLH